MPTCACRDLYEDAKKEHELNLRCTPRARAAAAETPIRMQMLDSASTRRARQRGQPRLCIGTQRESRTEAIAQSERGGARAPDLAHLVRMMVVFTVPPQHLPLSRDLEEHFQICIVCADLRTLTAHLPLHTSRRTSSARGFVIIGHLPAQRTRFDAHPVVGRPFAGGPRLAAAPTGMAQMPLTRPGDRKKSGPGLA